MKIMKENGFMEKVIEKEKDEELYEKMKCKWRYRKRVEGMKQIKLEGM